MEENKNAPLSVPLGEAALKKKGVTPLERGRKTQKAQRSGHKSDGRETKALSKKNPLKEDSMNQQTAIPNGASETKPMPELTTDQAMSHIAYAMSGAAERAAKGQAVLTVATITPLKRLALESAVKFGIAGAIATGVCVGLRYTVFRPVGQ